MKPRHLLAALAIAAAALAAPLEDVPEEISLTVARRAAMGRPAEIAMAVVPGAELVDWLGARLGRDPVHVELEADRRGGLPTLRITDGAGRIRETLARPRDLTRARALLSAAMAQEAREPVADEAALAGVPMVVPAG